MGPSDLTLASDLDLEYSRSNMELAISQSKMMQLLRNKKKMIVSIEHLASNVTICFGLGHDLDSDFQGEIFK